MYRDTVVIGRLVCFQGGPCTLVKCPSYILHVSKVHTLSVSDSRNPKKEPGVLDFGNEEKESVVVTKDPRYRSPDDHSFSEELKRPWYYGDFVRMVG